jgi:hypothetical protein
MVEFRRIWLLLICLASWCAAFHIRHESVCTLPIVPGHLQLRSSDISIGLNQMTFHARDHGMFCLALRGGQGERKQRSEDKAKKSIHTSSSNKTVTKKLPPAKNRDVQADVPPSNKLKSKSGVEISNPTSDSELDFSQLTLKV